MSRVWRSRLSSGAELPRVEWTFADAPYYINADPTPKWVRETVKVMDPNDWGPIHYGPTVPGTPLRVLGESGCDFLGFLSLLCYILVRLVHWCIAEVGAVPVPCEKAAARPGCSSLSSDSAVANQAKAGSIVLSGAPLPSLPAAKHGSPATPSVGQKRESLAGRVCRVCDQEAYKRSRYCDEHKKAYECIYRTVSEDHASPQWEAFVKIFGGKLQGIVYGGDEVIAGKVLCEFCVKFPAAGSGGKKSTKKRGTGLDLLQFVRSEGTRQQEGEWRGARKMDYELFVVAMETHRKWTQAQACDARIAMIALNALIATSQLAKTQRLSPVASKL